MSQKLRVRPTKPMSIMGLIVAIAMFAFGIFFLTAVLRDSGSEPGPVSAFMVVWFIALGVIIFYFIFNLRSRTGVIEIDAEDGPPGAGAEPDFESRLRKLEGLKKDGLVTDDEYRAKRAEILGEKW